MQRRLVDGFQHIAGDFDFRFCLLQLFLLRLLRLTFLPAGFFNQLADIPEIIHHAEQQTVIFLLRCLRHPAVRLPEYAAYRPHITEIRESALFISHLADFAERLAPDFALVAGIYRLICDTVPCAAPCAEQPIALQQIEPDREHISEQKKQRRIMQEILP